MGFADARIAKLIGTGENDIRRVRKEKEVEAVFNSVDTCGAEFQAFTPYLYSTYEGEDESKPTARKKIMILGGGPNRIGQGIEFDYCCVHAAFRPAKKRATKPSWSTAIRRPSARITILRTSFISSR